MTLGPFLLSLLFNLAPLFFFFNFNLPHSTGPFFSDYRHTLVSPNLKSLPWVLLSPSNSYPIVLDFHQLSPFSSPEHFSMNSKHLLCGKKKKAPVYYYKCHLLNCSSSPIQRHFILGYRCIFFSYYDIRFKRNFIMYLLRSPKPRGSVFK